MTDLNKLINMLPEAFQPDQAINLEMKVVFEITEEQQQSWTVVIKDQACQIVDGNLMNPDLHVKAKYQDVIKILTGELDPTKAVLLGKVKLLGPINIAMKFAGLFSTEKLKQSNCY
jgi:putative sterol carrier protein